MGTGAGNATVERANPAVTALYVTVALPLGWIGYELGTDRLPVDAALTGAFLVITVGCVVLAAVIAGAQVRELITGRRLSGDHVIVANVAAGVVLGLAAVAIELGYVGPLTGEEAVALAGGGALVGLVGVRRPWSGRLASRVVAVWTRLVTGAGRVREEVGRVVRPASERRRITDYIAADPNRIERGMRIVERDYRSGKWRFHFLAEDRNGRQVVIHVPTTLENPTFPHPKPGAEELVGDVRWIMAVTSITDRQLTNAEEDDWEIAIVEGAVGTRYWVRRAISDRLLGTGK